MEKYLFSSLAHFLIESLIFLELSFRSCLYIFEMSCLSVASFAIIFSHSEGCLFTLLIVFFIVRKLLSLIRSHLFIFAFIANLLQKMGQRTKQTFLQRRHTDGYQTHEKMLNITHYQRNANQNHNDVPFHASQNGCDPKVYKQ